MSHSQFNEFEIIRGIFPNINDGTFIDIGAGSPIQFSNTYDLYQLGWSGLLIEPQSKYAGELRATRPRDITIQTALSNYEGSIQLYGSDLHCTVEKGYTKGGGTPVPVTTFNRIREQYPELCEKCQVCNVDTDYHEAKVFEGMDLDLFNPTLFIIESVNKLKYGKDYLEAWEPTLFENNYKVVARSSIPINYFYMKE